MNTVIIINLAGRSYHIEESGAATIRAYLDAAREHLKTDPDQNEIMRDLEQAIAERCDRLLSHHKTVIASAEAATIVADMGPVHAADNSEKDSSGNGEKSESKSHNTNIPKKLYNLRDGAMIAGVCNGLGAYFNIDATIVRIVFVILAVLTHGAWIAVYAILAFVIPYAKTDQDIARAHGAPSNAQELIAQIKENFNRRGEWKQNFRTQRNKWQREWHAMAHDNKKRWGETAAHMRGPVAGLTTALLGIVTGAITVLWILAVISLITTGMIFGWVVPFAIPIWITVVIMIIIYNIILVPIRAAKYSHHHQGEGWFGTVDAVMWIGIFAVIGWVLYHYVPFAHNWMNAIANWFQNLVAKISHK